MMPDSQGGFKTKGEKEVRAPPPQCLLPPRLVRSVGRAPLSRLCRGPMKSTLLHPTATVSARHHLRGLRSACRAWDGPALPGAPAGHPETAAEAARDSTPIASEGGGGRQAPGLWLAPILPPWTVAILSPEGTQVTAPRSAPSASGPAASIPHE